MDRNDAINRKKLMNAVNKIDAIDTKKKITVRNSMNRKDATNGKDTNQIKQSWGRNLHSLRSQVGKIPTFYWVFFKGGTPIYNEMIFHGDNLFPSL